MPFCTKCGQQTGETDRFCARCGAVQDPARPTANTGAPTDYLANVSNRTASILCYVPILGWIAGVAVLASKRFAHDPAVRFHAFQGIYLFVIWLLVEWVLEPMIRMTGGGRQMLGFVTGLLHVSVFVAWIIMLIKTSQNQMYSLPIVGEWAERSVAEQQGQGPA